MKAMKRIGMAVAALSISISLGAGLANAAPGNKPNNPPEDSGRDVIGNASTLCAFDAAPDPGYAPADLPDYATDAEVSAFACGVLWKTDGNQVMDRGCPEDTGGTIDAADGFPYVEYTGRNCDTNRLALMKQMGSVILSLDDVIVRGKEQQRDAAITSACIYAAKVYDLLAAGKLNENPGAADGGLDEDLAADAEDIIAALDPTGAGCE